MSSFQQCLQRFIFIHSKKNCSEILSLLACLHKNNTEWILSAMTEIITKKKARLRKITCHYEMLENLEMSVNALLTLQCNSKRGQKVASRAKYVVDNH